MRRDGRPDDQLRPITVTRGFTTAPAGSVLWKQGGTIILATASLSTQTPPWFAETRQGGWVTAEYVMLPGSTPARKEWPKVGHTDSRGTEIQRLIGRAIRGVTDLSRLGRHTIALDCQVLQADGGTRTASICAAYIALVDAVRRLPADRPQGPGNDLYDPSRVVVDRLSAVSVGVVEDAVRLDLDYADDSRAAVDLNVAMTGAGALVEVQGAAENGGGFDRRRLNAMLNLAEAGCRRLMEIQESALHG